LKSLPILEGVEPYLKTPVFIEVSQCCARRQPLASLECLVEAGPTELRLRTTVIDGDRLETDPGGDWLIDPRSRSVLERTVRKTHLRRPTRSKWRRSGLCILTLAVSSIGITDAARFGHEKAPSEDR
jgi:hypothetical protein